MSSYILCKILSFLTRVAQKVFNRPGSYSLVELIILWSFNIQNWFICSSIRNRIAYANEPNIVNKDSPIVKAKGRYDHTDGWQAKHDPCWSKSWLDGYIFQRFPLFYESRRFLLEEADFLKSIFFFKIRYTWEVFCYKQHNNIAAVLIFIQSRHSVIKDRPKNVKFNLSLLRVNEKLREKITWFYTPLYQKDKCFSASIGRKSQKGG